jgi:hypothetical protein
MTDSVNIVQWNCQGFNAHGPEYIWSLSKQKHIPDIASSFDISCGEVC